MDSASQLRLTEKVVTGDSSCRLQNCNVQCMCYDANELERLWSAGDIALGIGFV